MIKLLLIPVLLGMGTLLYIFASQPILIESAESRTIEGGPVFNEIQWSWKNGREIWSMRQSHGGRNLPKEKWDKLAIHLEKKATFLQTDPLSGNRVEYKVSCFMCHPNGPRVIRPVEGSLGISDNLRVKLLNLRIKLYGRVQSKILPQIGKTPFRHEGKISNEILTLSRCTSCHKEDGFFARGPLTRQNSLTINFMVNEKHMPPLGDLTSSERTYLDNFMNGF